MNKDDAARAYNRLGKEDRVVFLLFLAHQLTAAARTITSSPEPEAAQRKKHIAILEMLNHITLHAMQVLRNETPKQSDGALFSVVYETAAKAKTVPELLAALKHVQERVKGAPPPAGTPA